tara:strand:- start:68 stop:1087 length:1020 start_codon:yes stop_codon:yes gene_type:complete
MHNYNSNLSKKILYWYDNNKRMLPWRFINSKKKLGFYTLVSEFMLQQTQIKTVLPYFLRFIKRFPNIRKLSNANTRSILKQWEGLGYYSRAKNLHLTSKIICKKYSEKIPQEINDLKLLPGIGDYTASILMAVVHNKPYIAFDGNVKRVMSRFFGINYDENSENLKLIKNKSNVFLSQSRHGDLAQALMELGALVCKPTNPKCFRCPLKKFCSFKKSNIYFTKKIKRSNKLKYVALCYLKKNKVLVTNKNPSGFLNDMLTVPMIKLKNFHKLNYKKNCEILNKEVSHSISNSNLKIKIALSRKNLNLPNHFWLDKKNIKKHPIPALTKKIFKAINLDLQ